MSLLYSFLFCGIICLIGQIILDNTNLTPGHITSIFVVTGTVLGVTGLYTKYAKIIGMGANLPIISFGNTLTETCAKEIIKNGIMGAFNLLSSVSVGITSAVVFSFIIMLFTKLKD